MPSDDELILAFVQGAKYQAFRESTATLWRSEVEEAEARAKELLSEGRLGKKRDDPR